MHPKHVTPQPVRPIDWAANLTTELLAPPTNEDRPLQIIHGFDRWLTHPEQPTGEAGIDAFLERLCAMGIGGIVTNVSSQDYLQSPRQWEILRYGLRKAHALGLVLWLYDERGYPSGSAGGIVTRAHPEYIAQGLACYQLTVTGPVALDYPLPLSCQTCIWASATQTPATATTASILDLTPQVDTQGTLHWNVPTGAWTILYLAQRIMYEGTHAAGNFHEFRQYPNLLDPRAVAAFIRVTHEQYRREIPPDLWSAIRAIFTDEPSLMATYAPDLPASHRDKVAVLDRPLFTDRPPAVPWVAGLLARFQVVKGYDLRPRLFQLFISDTPEASFTRQDFYEVVTQIYCESYYQQIQNWCRPYGIAASGHILAEENLLDHVRYHGSLFAAIRALDVPGIDMLDADPQRMLAGEGFMVAKQAASVAHLTGAKAVHSETCDFFQRLEGRQSTAAERIGQANLLYVLGINQITAYWNWEDIGAEAYHQYNDYLGRLARLLRGGVHVCAVAVLYPIRTLWAHFTPAATSPYKHPWLQSIAKSFVDLVRELLCHQIDVDLIDEAALISGIKRAGQLWVADEAYRVVLLPPLDTLSLATAEALLAFAHAGGKVFGIGAPPVLAESQACTQRLSDLMAQLFTPDGPGQICEIATAAKHLQQAGVVDLELSQPDAEILFTHRRQAGREIYFVVNVSPHAKEIQPRLPIPGPYCIYRPLTEAIESCVDLPQLALTGYEGIFLLA
ncbi:hypothetical protein L0128_20415, partial [candidate division KSB1 bacterium]|nr:hypothetical protein [candidate division KSB1 bacterium]